jgi:hypothetical protein
MCNLLTHYVKSEFLLKLFTQTINFHQLSVPAVSYVNVAVVQYLEIDLSGIFNEGKNEVQYYYMKNYLG